MYIKSEYRKLAPTILARFFFSLLCSTAERRPPPKEANHPGPGQSAQLEFTFRKFTKNLKKYRLKLGHVGALN